MPAYLNGRHVAGMAINGTLHKAALAGHAIFPPFFGLPDYHTRSIGVPDRSASVMVLKWDTTNPWNWITSSLGEPDRSPSIMRYLFISELIE